MRIHELLESEKEYDADWDDMVSRVGAKAKQGPLKTVWDPATRKYKNVPVNEPKKDEKQD
jgi:hypothetical protein